jgi:HSP20 family protein
MNIVRWAPFRETVSLSQLMDRLLEDSVARPWPVRRNGDSRVIALPLDVYATESELVIKASVPGIDPEQIEVTLEGDCLTIKGERKEEQEIKRESYVRQERYYGTFFRQVTLPENMRGGDATASYENGVLTITVPKAEEAKPRQIKVKAETKK